jgi:hypothetical protein
LQTALIRQAKRWFVGLRRKYDKRVIKKAMHPLQRRSAAIEGGKFRKYTQATKQQLNGRR